MDVPQTPLPFAWRFGIYRAPLSYRERERAQAKCWNCLESGHVAGDCKREVICRACGGKGHKQSDPVCPGKAKEADKYATAESEDATEDS